MDKDRVEEHQKSVVEQLEAIAKYVDKFSVLTQKDEAALMELVNTVNALTLRVQEIDMAQKKRIQLMNELANAYNDLEDSHKKFADNVKVKTT